MVLPHFEFKYCRASREGGHDSAHLELAGFERLHGWGDVAAFIWNLQVLKDVVGGGDIFIVRVTNFYLPTFYAQLRPA